MEAAECDTVNTAAPNSRKRKRAGHEPTARDRAAVSTRIHTVCKSLKKEALVVPYRRIMASDWPGRDAYAVGVQDSVLKALGVEDWKRVFVESTIDKRKITELTDKVSKLESEIAGLKAQCAMKPDDVVDADMRKYFGGPLVAAQHAYFETAVNLSTPRRDRRQALCKKLIRSVERSIANSISSKHNDSVSANAGRRYLAREALQDAFHVLLDGGHLDLRKYSNPRRMRRAGPETG